MNAEINMETFPRAKSPFACGPMLQASMSATSPCEWMTPAFTCGTATGTSRFAPRAGRIRCFPYYETLAEIEDEVQEREGLKVTIASGEPLTEEG